jgi:hypothetical protein
MVALGVDEARRARMGEAAEAWGRGFGFPASFADFWAAHERIAAAYHRA